MKDDLLEEYEAVGQMIEAAEKEGLLVEVIYSFGRLMEGGARLDNACTQALYEWDI